MAAKTKKPSPTPAPEVEVIEKAKPATHRNVIVIKDGKSTEVRK